MKEKEIEERKEERKKKLNPRKKRRRRRMNKTMAYSLWKKSHLTQKIQFIL